MGNEVSEQMEYQIKWQGYDEPSWEPKSCLRNNGLFEFYCRDHNIPLSGDEDSDGEGDHSDHADPDWNAPPSIDNNDEIASTTTTSNGTIFSDMLDSEDVTE